jgi:hypothetical protein
LLAAVNTGFPFLAPGIVLFEEFLAHTNGNMVPWENLIKLPFTLTIKKGIKVSLLESIPPSLNVQLISPGIEFGAILPGIEDHLPEATITAGKPGFQLGGIRTVGGQLDAGFVEAIP